MALNNAGEYDAKRSGGREFKMNALHVQLSCQAASQSFLPGDDVLGMNSGTACRGLFT
jgi:hypothetical protein